MRDALDGAVAVVSTAIDHLGRGLAATAVAAVAVGWIGFWASAARLHHAAGDTVGAVATTALLVAPPAIVAWWEAGRRFEPELDLDGAGLGSEADPAGADG